MLCCIACCSCVVTCDLLAIVITGSCDVSTLFIFLKKCRRFAVLFDSELIASSHGDVC